MATVSVGGSVGAGTSVAAGGSGEDGVQAVRSNNAVVKSRMVFRMVEF
jgi:hypothetical protein